MLSKKLNTILSGIVFLTCLSVGFRLAAQKPLWNDELYTLVSSVQGSSYSDMVLGKVGEGNNAPLFYLIQKVICDSMRYVVPFQWIHGDWGVTDVYSQILLRINPVVFMSLSIVTIFYFFSQYYSIWAGIYSIMISLSSFMIWVFWAEARPYALWVFLTTLQSFIFMEMIKTEGNRRNNWNVLSIIHILLAFSTVISVIQIAAVSLLLRIMMERNWKKYIQIFLIPVVICFFYYFRAPKYMFWFAEGPWALINASIPKDRFLIFFIFAVYFCLVYIQPKLSFLRKLPIRLMDKEGRRDAGSYFCFMVLMMAGFFLVLLKFKFGASANHEGFQVSSRYFIGLTPVGIIATTLFSIYLVQCSRHKAIQGIMFLLLGGLLIMRILRTIQLV